MATNQYPTYGMDTNMGMNRPYSNALRQGAQNQFGQQGPSYGSTASNQARNDPWTRSTWGSARGGGMPVGDRGATDAGQPRDSGLGNTGPYNPNGGPQNYPQWQPTQQYTPQPYQAPSAWQPYQVQQPAFNQGTQQTYTPWTPTGFPQDPSGWNTQALRDQYSQYMSTMLPYMQYQQNNQQYTQDFNEAQRRWNEQFGWTQQGDRFNQDLAQRQQQMAEWQAGEAARQWENQFGWQQQSDLFSQDLANRQFGLQQQQLAVEEAYNQGRLTNEQRQIALAELQAQQDEAFRRYQLGEQLGFSREELAATQQYRQQQDALARAQMAQEYQLAQQQMEAQRQNALMQAYGRNQAPNAKWMRRTG